MIASGICYQTNWSIFQLELRKTNELPEKNHYSSNFIDQQKKQKL